MNIIDKPIVFRIEKSNRNPIMHQENITKYLRFKITKARCPWSNQVPKEFKKQEDGWIKNLVSLNGTKNWTLIATEMKAMYGVKNRTGKQCRERYYFLLF